MSKTFLLVLVASLTMVTFVVPPAEVHARLPQVQEEQVLPPRPGRPDDSRGILWSYAALALIIGAVFAANTIPSKRGHQD